MRPSILLVFSTSQEECGQMLRGIAEYGRTHHQCDAYLDDEARAVHDLGWLRSRRWAGVISRHSTSALIDYCLQHGLPLVDMSDEPSSRGVPKVRPDNVAIGHYGAEHLLERGFRSFGFAGYSNETWSCERRDGFIEALRLAGHGCDVLDVIYPGVLTPRWDVAQKELIADWLKTLAQPTGVMACCDLRAQELISGADEAGFKVPEDTAVVGANNETVRCELAFPTLSSVAPNSFQSGYRAAECLYRMMAGESLAPTDLRIEPLQVVTRRSSDVLAIEDRVTALALSIIRDRACTGISVDEVVRAAHSSRSQLEKKFRQFLGRSPQAEIRRVQINRVKQLLAETRHPLKKIAELTGFEHVEYLSVVFKRTTGNTPGRYRQLAHATG
jgi:LacI family transcriptional regulator